MSCLRRFYAGLRAIRVEILLGLDGLGDEVAVLGLGWRVPSLAQAAWVSSARAKPANMRRVAVNCSAFMGYGAKE